MQISTSFKQIITLWSYSTSTRFELLGFSERKLGDGSVAAALLVLRHLKSCQFWAALQHPVVRALLYRVTEDIQSPVSYFMHFLSALIATEKWTLSFGAFYGLSCGFQKVFKGFSNPGRFISNLFLHSCTQIWKMICCSSVLEHFQRLESVIMATFLVNYW